jgi:predicted Zn-dependent protease with MMP-like domain
VAVITAYIMKPKFLPVLEMCIENGLTYGYRRAFKHTDNPTEEQITDQIKQSIMHELYEWFDMENVNESKD